MAKKQSTYGVSEEAATKKIQAPELPYRPATLKRYKPTIGLIACGGITQSHLRAYRMAGYNVVALCDLILERAENRRREFYPDAKTYTDYRELLKRDDIDVVDIATHPPERLKLIEDALKAGKHVLSQKPFVIDLDKGEKLVDLADKMGVKFAVNQNGRWAPHWSYMRHAANKGLIGEPIAAHLSCHFNHDWTATTPFNNVRHLVLYDYAIHWFDILTCFMGKKTPTRVYASNTRAKGQTARPPLLGQALIEYDDAQATLAFDGFIRRGSVDRTFVGGTKGSMHSEGADINKQKVILYTDKGIATPKLEGAWFKQGFHGTMAELLSAIEQKREPSNNARDNLRSLALCFAACRSADSGKPEIPGKVRKLPKD